VLEKTLEVSNSSIIFTDPEGNITYVNPSFVRRTGFSVEEVIGKNPSILKSGKQSPEVYQELWQTIKGGGTWIGHLQNRCKDGSLVWEHVTIFPVFDEHQKISNYVAIKEDVTKQRRGESILRCVGEVNQLLLRSISLDATLPAILELLGKACEVDRAYLFRYKEPISAPGEGRITLTFEWNSGDFEPQINNPDLQDLSVSEGLLHEWIRNLSAGNTVQARSEELPGHERKIMRQQGIRSLLLVPVHKGRSLYGFLGFDDCHRERDWSKTEVSLLVSVAGNLGIILQRKDYEHDIQEALLKAESSAMEAIRANTAKSAFLATMSHEIRTPLNGILGMTQILLDEETDKEKLDFLQTVHSSGQSLHNVLNDILDFSKIEAGKLEIVRREFSLQKVVSEVHQLFAPLAAKKQIQFVLDLSPSTAAPFHGDPDRLRQILSNLVSNALKFTESGEVRVQADLKENPPALLSIEVSDTGVGIHPDVQGNLFEMFTQADSTTTRRFGGTGLGLAICRRLAEAMEGRIWFESTPFRGSRFFLEIPCKRPQPEDSAQSDREPDPNRPGESPMENGTPERFGRLKVLVVEDNPVNQRVIKLQLQSLGLSCEIAHEGGSAVERFEQGETFDLIFMDCQMPGLNGFDATEKILTIASPKPTIVALTASASTIDRERAREAGMKDYLVKPVTKERIQSAIKELFPR